MSKVYHGFDKHNTWIRKGYPCPYCIKGSKPVPETLLSLTDDEIKKFIESETKKIKSGDFEDGK